MKIKQWAGYSVLAINLLSGVSFAASENLEKFPPKECEPLIIEDQALGDPFYIPAGCWILQNSPKFTVGDEVLDDVAIILEPHAWLFLAGHVISLDDDLAHSALSTVGVKMLSDSVLDGGLPDRREKHRGKLAGWGIAIDAKAEGKSDVSNAWGRYLDIEDPSGTGISTDAWSGNRFSDIYIEGDRYFPKQGACEVGVDIADAGLAQRPAKFTHVNVSFCQVGFDYSYPEEIRNQGYGVEVIKSSAYETDIGARVAGKHAKFDEFTAAKSFNTGMQLEEKDIVVLDSDIIDSVGTGLFIEDPNNVFVGNTVIANTGPKQNQKKFAYDVVVNTGDCNNLTWTNNYFYTASVSCLESAK